MTSNVCSKHEHGESQALFSEETDMRLPDHMGPLLRSDPNQDTAGACIMVVDDEPNNLNILGTMLRIGRYNVVAFPEGRLALEAADEVKPDLVLLDVGLPDMNGLEVCRQLKNKPGFENVPVIFLSAHAETEEKILGFLAGAVDYVTKPFSEKEVLARVRTHLSIRWHTLHLDDLIQKHSCELSDAHRRLRSWDEAKNHWIQMLAHELRTPLTSVFCTASVLFKKMPKDSDYVEMREDFDWSFNRINKLIDDAIALANLGEQSMALDFVPIEAGEIMQAACLRARQRATDVRFVLADAGETTATLMVAPELVLRAITDLLITAACCTPEGGTVTLSSFVKNDRLQIDIATSGKGLPPADLETFFDIGGQRTLVKGGADFGLGPALGKRILLLFDGEVSVRNGNPSGLVIGIRLPVSPEQTDQTNDTLDVYSAHQALA